MYQVGLFISEALLKDESITATDKLVIAATRHAPHLTQEKIAQMIGLNVRTVRRIYKDLNINKEDIRADQDNSVYSAPEPKPKAKAKKGPRIEEYFVPSNDTFDWCMKNQPSVNLAEETEKFINYYLAAPGARGIKVDWNRAFRNWIINANKWKVETKDKGGLWNDIADDYRGGHQEAVRPLRLAISGGDVSDPWVR